MEAEKGTAWSLEFGVWRLEFGAWSLALGVWSLEFGAWSLALGVWSLEFGAWSLALGVNLTLGEDIGPRAWRRQVTHARAMYM